MGEDLVHAYLLTGGSPLGKAKLAGEAGLANNTVAAGYGELLSDLMCVGQGPAWAESRRITAGLVDVINSISSIF